MTGVEMIESVEDAVAAGTGARGRPRHRRHSRRAVCRPRGAIARAATPESVKHSLSFGAHELDTGAGDAHGPVAPNLQPLSG